MNFNSLSRRDFLKKTTVLTVGISSMTLMSGFAMDEYYSCIQGPDCPINVVATGGTVLINNGLHDVYDCTCTGVAGCCGKTNPQCGKWWDSNLQKLVPVFPCDPENRHNTVQCINP